MPHFLNPSTLPISKLKKKNLIESLLKYSVFKNFEYCRKFHLPTFNIYLHVFLLNWVSKIE